MQTRVLVDLGMGTGKVALQAFLQFGNLNRVVGVELSASRYAVGERALFRLVELLPQRFRTICCVPGHFIAVCDIGDAALDDLKHIELTLCQKPRILEFVLGNLMDLEDSVIISADVVMLETDIPNNKLHEVRVVCYIFMYLVYFF